MTDWKVEEDKYVLPTYAKFPFVLERGEGSWVWDDAGNRYLDLYGGHAVGILGHSPRPVVQAIAEQASKLLFYSNVTYLAVRAQAARALVEFVGREGAQVFFCNSGAEANENAMKLARVATGRPEIVATTDAFHGRTAAALAATGMPKYKKDPSGLGTNVTHVPFGDLAAAERAIGPKTAGVILEPIQSMAGVVVPPPGYLQELAKLCRERGAMLIFDEIQTGLGRVGAPTAAHLYGVSPDIQTFAKGLASGVPIGATVAAANVAKHVKPGDLGSTFGGGPLGCAATVATLGILRSQELWENAAKREAQVRETFRFPALKEIRGKGLLLGLVFDRPAKEIRDALLAKKILVGTSEDPAVVRLLPPLTLSAEEMGLLHGALSEIFAAVPAAMK